MALSKNTWMLLGLVALAWWAKSGALSEGWATSPATLVQLASSSGYYPYYRYPNYWHRYPFYRNGFYHYGYAFPEWRRRWRYASHQDNVYPYTWRGYA